MSGAALATIAIQSVLVGAVLIIGAATIRDLLGGGRR
jgi:hypothetical protein